MVDDQPSNADLLNIALAAEGFKVFKAYSGESALKLLQDIAAVVDLVLLDVNMPGMDGYQMCSRMKADDKLKEIPVMFVSAIDDVTVKMNGFQVGGVDYITKPFHRIELVARIRTHVDLRRKQREIEALHRNEVEHYRRMNTVKDNMLQVVSHDLKNPLSAIISGLGILKLTLWNAIQSDDKALSGFQLIGSSADKMRGMIHDLLDLVLVEGTLTLNRELTWLIPYLEKRLNDFNHMAAEKQITLKFTPPPYDFQVAIAPDRFAQVLENLLSNAIKYTDPQGMVELVAVLERDGVHISVRDTGPGIAEDDLPHLFEKFYRVRSVAHRDQTGTGLGLVIAKLITELHQGRIEVQSQIGKGSTFTVVLPA
ncbi:MAG: hybrid sensor histidine kinase/response regulator [Anaerolineae bacterium]